MDTAAAWPQGSQTAICLPGLGTDRRIFGGLRVEGWHFYTPQLPLPLRRETFGSYAARLADSIAAETQLPEPWAVIGVSFGGMLAVELAEHVRTQPLVLISSNKCRQEFPPRLRAFRYTGIPQVAPARALHAIVRYAPHVARRLTPEQLAEWDDMVRNYPPALLKWAANRILGWQRRDPPVHALHLHGTHDHLLPYSRVCNATPLEGANHFSIMRRHDDLNRWLREVLPSAAAGLATMQPAQSQLVPQV